MESSQHVSNDLQTEQMLRDRDYELYLEECLVDESDESDDDGVYYLTASETEDYDTFVYGAPLIIYQNL